MKNTKGKKAPKTDPMTDPMFNAAYDHIFEIVDRANAGSCKDEVLFSNIVRLKKRECQSVIDTTLNYIRLAKSLRRQLFAQLAKCQGVYEQGQLFE
jgi:hypothetical protein